MTTLDKIIKYKKMCDLWDELLCNGISDIHCDIYPAKELSLLFPGIWLVIEDGKFHVKMWDKDAHLETQVYDTPEDAAAFIDKELAREE